MAFPMARNGGPLARNGVPLAGAAGDPCCCPSCRAAYMCEDDSFVGYIDPQDELTQAVYDAGDDCVYLGTEPCPDPMPEDFLDTSGWTGYDSCEECEEPYASCCTTDTQLIVTIAGMAWCGGGSCITRCNPVDNASMTTSLSQGNGAYLFPNPTTSSYNVFIEDIPRGDYGRIYFSSLTCTGGASKIIGRSIRYRVVGGGNCISSIILSMSFLYTTLAGDINTPTPNFESIFQYEITCIDTTLTPTLIIPPFHNGGHGGWVTGGKVVAIDRVP